MRKMEREVGVYVAAARCYTVGSISTLRSDAFSWSAVAVFWDLVRSVLDLLLPIPNSSLDPMPSEHSV